MSRLWLSIFAQNFEEYIGTWIHWCNYAKHFWLYVSGQEKARKTGSFSVVCASNFYNKFTIISSDDISCI